VAQRKYITKHCTKPLARSVTLLYTYKINKITELIFLQQWIPSTHITVTPIITDKTSHSIISLADRL